MEASRHFYLCLICGIYSPVDSICRMSSVDYPSHMLVVHSSSSTLPRESCRRDWVFRRKPRLTYFSHNFLDSDLGLGSIYYRKLINLSSGWIHHTVYIGLFSLWVHKGWAHIAMMASIFELPTFIMGVASIHPPLRSNNAFTSTFLITRVFLHSALLCAAFTEHGRSAPGINGSWGPCISLAATLPMHIWWGYKCILR